MPRINFQHTVWRKSPTLGGQVEPLENVSATGFSVNKDGVESGSEATIFAARLGTSAGDPMSNADGVVDFWLDPDDYNVHFEDTNVPARISPFSVGVNAISGATEGIQFAQLPAVIQALLDTVPAPGDLKAVAYTAATGWLLCDGSTPFRTEYPDLFAKISTNFNIGGELSTKFRLPDLRGRVPVGADLSAGRLSANNILGKSSGAEKFVFDSNSIPRHGHGYGANDQVADVGRVPVLRESQATSPYWRQADFTPGSGAERVAYYHTGLTPIVSATHTGGVTGVADSSARSNPDSTDIGVVQPYQIINWLIKT